MKRTATMRKLSSKKDASKKKADSLISEDQENFGTSPVL
jgi:hypothetical protein